jgi:phosphate transport system substrate-binding protein
MAALLALGSLFACAAPNDNGGTINVVTRENGSGTRSAFTELFEVLVEQDGKKVDAVTASAVETNSTAVMLSTIKGDPKGIGYISLGSLSSDVTALKIDGVDATAANVKSGSYKISRPFNIATKGTPSGASADFINYIMSSEGQKIISDFGCVAVKDSAAKYTSSATSGEITVAGSSSVSPVMELLIAGYKTANPNVKVTLQTSDSSTGMTQAIDGICDIGMASRDLKDTEKSAGLTGQTIAIDGLAVIVNNSNPVKDMTKEQVKEIFLGEVTDWAKI